MNIIEQVTRMADHIVSRDSTWSTGIPLTKLYADALEVTFSRILLFEKELEELERVTGITPTAYNIIQALLEPMEEKNY